MDLDDPTSHPTVDLTGARVAVVDDDPLKRELLASLLGEHGLDVVTYDDGHAALAGIAAAPPELILLDVMMPGIDGYEVCRELAADPELGHVPVLFVSVLDRPEDRIRAFQAGAVDYLPSPVDGPELLARVTTHLQHHRMLHELTEREHLLTDLVAQRTEQLALAQRQLEQRNDDLAAAARDLLRAQRIAGIGSFEVDLVEERFSGSPMAYRLLGAPSVDSLPMTEIVALIHADDRERVEERWQQALATGWFHADHRVRREGRTGWVRLQAELEYDHDAPVRAHGTVLDVTERYEHAAQLEREQRRLRTILGVVRAGTWEWDLATDHLRVPATEAELLELTPLTDGPVLASDNPWLHPDDASALVELRARLLAGDLSPAEVEHRVRTRDGAWRWLRSSGRVVELRPDGTPAAVSGISIDIDESRAQREQLARTRSHDPVTGLLNRDGVRDALERELAQCERTGYGLLVLSLDLDHYDERTAALDATVTEGVLGELAGRLATITGDADRVGRVARDSFVVLVPTTSPEDSWERTARTVHRLVGQPFDRAGAEVTFSCGVGIASYPEPDPVDADQLLRHADQALYLAKRAGISRTVRFDADLERDQRDRQRCIDAISAGLDADQLRLHYQPKVELTTGRVVGFEALLRWDHPERGLLAPGHFLPAIEGHELSLRVGNWVIERALIQLGRWQAAGLTTTVSVNADTRQINDPSFVRRLRRQLAAHPQLDPGWLEVELLETATVADVEQVVRLVTEVRELGVAVSLDDFGTGISSLTLLKRLGVTALKIDRSFVLDLLEDPELGTIIASIRSLAGHFGIDAVAEGVETVAHGTRLIELGCRLGQGYAIARPMPPDEVPGWLERWTVPAAWRDAAAGS